MGCVHIYTGDGKGKTTAAMGLAVRASGCGKRVAVYQFLKGRDSGEVVSLQNLSIPVTRNSRPYGWFFSMSKEDQAEMIAEHNGQLEEIMEGLSQDRWDVLILDELIGAYQMEALNRELVERLLAKSYSCELVLTGRNPPDWMIDRADYVTEMQKKKHPFDHGLVARKGIEF
jgi:cob(I)alamin adenosyltransferase